MKIIGLLLCVFLLSSCDNDEYVTYKRQKEFTITKLKTSGKRASRGFYVEGSEDKVRYRDVRAGKLKEGDKILLSYDSIVNVTKGTYEIDLQRRYSD